MYYRTAESVSPKHPDKLCDQISDAILDAYLAEDPESRVAVETCGGHGVVFVTGEVTSKASNVDIPAIVHRIAGDVEIHIKIVQQSLEIAQGVDTGGAGDQGIMIGFACDETPELLPLEVVLSRQLNQYIYDKHPYDGKTQVTIAPDGTIDSIVASFQNVPSEELEKLVQEYVEMQEKAVEKLKNHRNTSIRRHRACGCFFHPLPPVLPVAFIPLHGYNRDAERIPLQTKGMNTPWKSA